MSQPKFELCFSAQPARLRESSVHRSFEAGAFLFREGAVISSVHFLEQGSARAVIYPADGKELSLYFANDGDPLALEHLARTTHAYSGIATERTVARLLDRGQFIKCLFESSSLMSHYMAYVSERCLRLQMVMERLALPTAKAMRRFDPVAFAHSNGQV